MKWIDIQDKHPDIGLRCLFFLVHRKSAPIESKFLHHVSIGDVVNMVDDPQRYGRYSGLMDVDFALDDHGPKLSGYIATHWMNLPEDTRIT